MVWGMWFGLVGGVLGRGCGWVDCGLVLVIWCGWLSGVGCGVFVLGIVV